jgi:hypothetical protein
MKIKIKKMKIKIKKMKIKIKKETRKKVYNYKPRI